MSNDGPAARPAPCPRHEPELLWPPYPCLLRQHNASFVARWA
ncbi:MAG TPA: hypothetical protein VH478_10745 [Trebonia sp.]|nr:hypothetical protein [Trebonia sp.]